MGKLFAPPPQSGKYRAFNEELLTRFWELRGGQVNENGSMAAFPSDLSWSAFWHYFPYELGEDLSDECMDALDVLLSSSRARLRLQRHAEALAGAAAAAAAAGGGAGPPAPHSGAAAAGPRYGRVRRLAHVARRMRGDARHQAAGGRAGAAAAAAAAAAAEGVPAWQSDLASALGMDAAGRWGTEQDPLRVLMAPRVGRQQHPTQLQDARHAPDPPGAARLPLWVPPPRAAAAAARPPAAGVQQQPARGGLAAAPFRYGMDLDDYPLTSDESDDELVLHEQEHLLLALMHQQQEDQQRQLARLRQEMGLHQPQQEQQPGQAQPSRRRPRDPDAPTGALPQEPPPPSAARHPGGSQLEPGGGGGSGGGGGGASGPADAGASASGSAPPAQAGASVPGAADAGGSGSAPPAGGGGASAPSAAEAGASGSAPPAESGGASAPSAAEAGASGSAPPAEGGGASAADASGSGGAPSSSFVAPAVWRALHDCLTEDGEPLLQILLKIVAITPPYAPASYTDAVLQRMAAACPQPPPAPAVERMAAFLRRVHGTDSAGASGRAGGDGAAGSQSPPPFEARCGAACCMLDVLGGARGACAACSCAPPCQLVRVVASSGYSRSALAAAAVQKLCGDQGGWQALVMDMRGKWEDRDVLAATAAGFLGPEHAANMDRVHAMAPLSGHIALLGAWWPAHRPLAIVLSEVDAAVQTKHYPEESALWHLLRCLLAWLPSAVVIMTASTDFRLPEDLLPEEVATASVDLPDSTVGMSSWAFGSAGVEAGGW